MVLNTVTAWVAVTSLQYEGYGMYQFFFFGWRVLDDRWHKFFIAWQVFDSIGALGTVVCAVAVAIRSANLDSEIEWFWRYPMIPVGAVSILIGAWPLIMWTELIIARNGIQSETDWKAVWLFIVQVGLMIVPSFSTLRYGASECCGAIAKCLPAVLCGWFGLSHRSTAVTAADDQQARAPGSVKGGSIVDKQPTGETIEMMPPGAKDAKAMPKDEGITAAEEPIPSNGPQSPKKKNAGNHLGDGIV
jgi:hypothetical protein